MLRGPHCALPVQECCGFVSFSISSPPEKGFEKEEEKHGKPRSGHIQATFRPHSGHNGQNMQCSSYVTCTHAIGCSSCSSCSSCSGSGQNNTGRLAYQILDLFWHKPGRSGSHQDSTSTAREDTDHPEA